MTKNRLSKILASAGIASRRACEELIFAGRVSVNGKVELLPQTLVDPSLDAIQVDGTPLPKEPSKVYYLLNKPEGYICSHARVGKKPIVLDLFPDIGARLFTVGRLDKDTSGLLLVTNDGHFAQKVIHPSSKIIKEYLVKVSEEVLEEHLKTLMKGARIDHRWIKPQKVVKVRKGTFKISLYEGKKHEVRILVERANLELLELKRIRIGPLSLGALPKGAYRNLSAQEKEQFLKPSL